MSIRREVLALLSDGRTHSGAALGAALGVTRAAVHRHIGALAALGVPVTRFQGRGYRLDEAFSLLDGGRIRAELDERARPLLREVVVFERTDSTNDRLLARGDARGVACLAEHQAAGRGRRGSAWHASAFGNLLLSVGWSYDAWPAAVTTLSLACAVAVARGLGRCGVAGLGIKWPNDIVWHGRKLAGLLIEAGGEASGPCRLVVGVGVNVRMAGDAAGAIDQDWTDLRSTGAPVPDRNRLAAMLISELLLVLDGGVSPPDSDWRAEYQRLDALRGRRVALQPARTGAAFTGTALGADEAGALLVRDDAGVTRRFWSGEVSVRQA